MNRINHQQLKSSAKTGLRMAILAGTAAVSLNSNDCGTDCGPTDTWTPSSPAIVSVETPTLGMEKPELAPEHSTESGPQTTRWQVGVWTPDESGKRHTLTGIYHALGHPGVCFNNREWLTASSSSIRVERADGDHQPLQSIDLIPANSWLIGVPLPTGENCGR